MSAKEFDALAVIALRKGKFYQKTRDTLLGQLPPNVDQQDVKQRLRTAIARIDNRLFLAKEEQKENIIDPTLPIERLQLNSDEIKKQVLRELGIPSE
jgi:hypothetical protein